MILMLILSSLWMFSQFHLMMNKEQTLNSVLLLLTLVNVKVHVLPSVLVSPLFALPTYTAHNVMCSVKRYQEQIPATTWEWWCVKENSGSLTASVMAIFKNQTATHAYKITIHKEHVTFSVSLEIILEVTLHVTMMALYYVYQGMKILQNTVWKKFQVRTFSSMEKLYYHNLLS